MSDFAANLAALKARISAAAGAAARDPAAVTVVAVTKAHGVGAVRAALAAGQRAFGENRVREATAKYPPLKAEVPDLRLHLIGPLQTNKVKDAVALFDAIETVDRPKLAHALAAEMARTGKRPVCLVEVNTGREPQKAGVAPDAADALIAECRALGLPLAGLMCIPPEAEGRVSDSPGLHFALLREIARRNGLAVLSMGMSADFETAIRFGATHVRIGTALFGPRPAS
ncbi:MAG: YggS family pyridoxal phosphate-dependent enzyme [Pseudomonadota bacterium]